ncbi:MAG: 23S rRNA (cytidine(2498)-2'-O)-methyltransferase RlmM [Gammaproteobacteria bacterium]|jgi:23S rRNA (cytidine2498-2'-O)-methyltransferase
METLQQLMLFCRPGFESECAAEMMQQASALGFAAYINARTHSGYAHLVSATGQDTSSLVQQIDFRPLIFTRQWFACTAKIEDLPETRRTVPLVTLASRISSELNSGFNDLELDYADTNEAKALNRFYRAFRPHMVSALDKQGLLDEHSRLRLHICFDDSSSAWIGVSHVHNSAVEPMGIPRLRKPASAPSRSTLKLEEAIHWFLSRPEQKRELKPGMHAVDLGAAPGGWTWQLVRRGLLVTAVDNGPMDRALMDTGMVVHHRTDAFTYAPEHDVDWLVCDMAERPLHVSRLVARWFIQRYTRAAIFNLKLPMKKRYQTVMECKQLLHQSLAGKNIEHRLGFKQLYHDREEVTACMLTHDA